MSKPFLTVNNGDRQKHRATSVMQSNKTVCSAGYGLMAGLILIAMAFQIWLLWAHWINPDEGAHLMDARFVLEGKVPHVDYDARQPLYVYAYVPFLKLFGSSIVSGRLMPLMATWLTGWVVFLIGRLLWDAKRGALAAFLYLCTPTILVNASVVKTEPLAMLVVALGMYSLLMHLHGGRLAWLLFSGIAFGTGYYIRESTLAGPLAATVVLLLSPRPFGFFLRQLAFLYGGLGLVCLGVLLWYSQYMTWGQMLHDSSLFPVYRIWITLKDFMESLFAIRPAGRQQATAQVIATIRRGHSSQPWEMTLANVKHAIKMNSPFVLATLIACAQLFRQFFQLGAKTRASTPELSGVRTALIWLLSLALLYGYYIVQRGFFQFYFRELIPPMALLLAWVLCGVLELLGYSRRSPCWVGLALLALTGVFFLQEVLADAGVIAAIALIGFLGWVVGRPWRHTSWPALVYAGGVISLTVGLPLLKAGLRSGPLGQWPDWMWMAVGVTAVMALFGVCVRSIDHFRLGGFAVAVVLTFVAVYAISYGAKMGVGPSYDCVWHPHVLREVLPVIRKYSRPEDTVVSGAVIWEFQAGRQPFALQTHPLGFRDNVSKKVPDLSVIKPPKLIVLDGYTEQTYLAVIPQMQEMLDRDYKLIKRVEGHRYPVSVYVRSGVQEEGL